MIDIVSIIDIINIIVISNVINIICCQLLPVEICNETFAIALAQVIEVPLVNTIKTNKVAHFNRLK